MKFTESMRSVLYQDVDFSRGLVAYRFMWSMGRKWGVEIQSGAPKHLGDTCIRRVRINENMWKLIERTTVSTPMSQGWRYQRKQHAKITGKYP